MIRKAPRYAKELGTPELTIVHEMSEASKSKAKK